MTRRGLREFGRRRTGLLSAVICGCLFSAPAWAQDCTPLLSLFQQGYRTADIARNTGLSMYEVEACRRELSRPIYVGPQGAPPLNAAGSPPRNAPGPPPLGAAGPPPLGAAGAPPVGREVKRLP